LRLILVNERQSSKPVDRADASKLNFFHRRAAKVAEKRKGFKKWRNETGNSSGKCRHDHAHSWMIFFATLCGLCGFAVNPLFF